MNLYPEMKLQKDGYAGGFSCGLTMTQSKTMEKFQKTDETTNIIRYSNEQGVELNIHREYITDDVFRVKTVVHNGSKEEIAMEMLASFALSGIHADAIHRLQSFWSAEGKLRTETIHDLHLEPSWNGCGLRVEKFGNVGSMPVRKYFPFLALEDYETGKVIGIQLYCAFSWQIEILCKEDDTLTVTGGLADRDFGQWMKRLAQGEDFESPEAVIATGDNLYDVCDKLVKAQRLRISPLDREMGILFNEYCTTWGNPSFENVKRICDKIAGKGVQFLVIDSGWYGKTDNWWDSIGDWDVNETKFPGGMKPIADYIRSQGMIPGLWYEMETVAKGSQYFNKEEYLLKKDGVPLTVGDRRFWDMENPWVIDYLSKKVIQLLKESGFGYLKVDYNDTIGIGCDDADGLGEGLRKKVEASKKFFLKIQEEIPDIVIENCSSGGHRLEPSMMEITSQASFSDAHETVAIPLIAANMHRVISPAQSQIWAVLRAEDSANRIYYSLVSTFLGRMCLSGDIYNLDDHQWEIVENGMRFYELVADIIRDGKTVYRESTTKQYNNPTGSQLVIRQLGEKNLAIYHRFKNSEPLSESFMENWDILAEYGEAAEDFSAKAWLYQ